MKELLRKNGKLIGFIIAVNAIITVFLVLVVFPGIEDTNIRRSAEQPDFVLPSSPVVDIVEEANPAVVSIVVTKEVPIYERYYEEYSPFGFQLPRERELGTEERQVGGGSGFIVSRDGLVITNRHVVSDPEADYTAFTKDGDKLQLEMVDMDPFVDIAVLRIDESGSFPHLSLGNSDNLRLGQTVITIGNALGEFRNSVSVGVISGLSRSIIAGGTFGEREQLENVIQTDAAINPGNSGGPLLDIAGRVVGVNVAVALGSENIGFALPSNVVQEILESIDTHGEIVRPYIGVRYAMITEELAERNGLPVDHGALILSGSTPAESAIVPGSPAAKAGLVENDIILEADGVLITLEHTLGEVIREYEVGDTIEFKVLHDGEEVTRSVVLEEAPDTFE